MAEANPNLVPHSREAEEALLGAVLIDPQALLLLDVETNDFYVHRHRWIWGALQSLRARGMQPDLVTLTEELERAGKLSEIGGPAYLAGLYNQAPNSQHATSYAAIVRDKARRRGILQVCNQLAKAAYADNGGLDDSTMQAVQSLTSNLKPRGAATPFHEYVTALQRDVRERAAHPCEVFGLETGLLDFDKITGGLQPGEAVYIGGEPGIGKSILSVQMGIGMAEHNHPGAIYSLEMRGLQVARRVVSALGRLETAHLKTGKLSEADWQAFERACQHAASLPVYMSDAAYWTTAGLRADLARLKAQHKIQWFVIDYLYLLSDGMDKDPTERTEILSSRIKLLCREFDLAGIAVNSVTKDGLDIRGSGQVKHDADIIGMLTEYQPGPGERKQANLRTFVFKKGRELVNPRTYFHLVKCDTYPAFQDYAYGHNNHR